MGALLLFLVCAAVASVVLASATAAAGRMSDLARNDQRYYSVASAAQLFRDELFDGSGEVVITVERTKSPGPEYSNKTSSSATVGAFSDLFIAYAKQYVFGQTDVPDGAGTEAQYNRAPEEQRAKVSDSDIVPPEILFAPLEQTYTIDPSDSDALKVKAKVQLEVDGSLLIDFFNVESDGSDSRDQFHLYLNCTAQVEEEDDADVSDLDEAETGDPTGRVNKRTIITWSPTELSTRGV